MPDDAPVISATGCSGHVRDSPHGRWCYPCPSQSTQLRPLSRLITAPRPALFTFATRRTRSAHCRLCKFRLPASTGRRLTFRTPCFRHSRNAPTRQHQRERKNPHELFSRQGPGGRRPLRLRRARYRGGSTQRRSRGGFSVRRALPHASRRTVGPFVFFDHFGPAEFKSGHGLDVRPHPHIGLSTLTYLYDGEIIHRDNLGVKAAIHPGAVNWMTAGRGIVHSERTAPEHRRDGEPLHGLQFWVGHAERKRGDRSELCPSRRQ